MEVEICYACKGKGELNYGMAAVGIYPDVVEYYRGIDTCNLCNGCGKIEKIYEPEGL